MAKVRDILKNFAAGAATIPAFVLRPFKRELPPLRNMARTGDARYTPQMATWKQNKSGVRVQMANRLDEIDFRDYERVRYYPVIRDGIRSIVAPAARANVHFTCDRPEVAELAQQELGPLMPSMIKQMLRAGLEFGYHAAEIRWFPKFDVIASGGLQSGGTERTERFYPFIWTVSRLAHFSPHDCRILIDTVTGDFAGIRQFVVAKTTDVPAYKCVIYTHDREFDGHYGVPLTKPAVPFVDVAISLFDSMAKYADLFAVPGMVGRYPMGRTAFADGVVMDNADLMQSLVESIGSGHRMSLPSNQYDTGGNKWDLTFFAPVSTSEPYTAMLGMVNDQIRLAIGVNEMASSETTKVGGLGDQGAEDKIGLFLQNIETYLDDLKPQVEKILDQFRIYNFGHDAPPLKAYFEPVDMNVTKALLAAVVQILSSGQPIQDAEGNLIYPDWGKILQDKGIPVVSVSGKRLAQQLLDAANQKIGEQRNPEGGEGGPAGDQLLQSLTPQPDQPDTKLKARKTAIKLLGDALGKYDTAPAIRTRLKALLSELDAEADIPDMMDPNLIEVHPDMQYKSGADGEGNTREWVEDAPAYDPSKSSPLLLWQASDGTRYVVDGHHRRQMAIDQGIASVPVSVIYEDEGVTFDQAKAAGIASNHKKGTFADWDESKHQRRDDGKFAPKGAGSWSGGDPGHDFGDVEHLGKDMKSPATSKQEAYDHAQAAYPEFKGLAQNIANSIGGAFFDGSNPDEWQAAKKADGPRVVVAPLKGEDRSTAKVEKDYEGDWGQIGDIVRGSVVVDKVEDIKTALDSLLSSGDWKLARKPKDRVRKPTTAGYRDILVNLEAPNGHNVELQVNHSAMIKAKGQAHDLYEEQAALERKVKSEKRRYTPEERARVNELLRKQNDIYGAAWLSANDQ